LIQVLWSAAERSRIEVPKVLGQSRYHRRAQDTPHVEHDRVRSAALDEGSQLILDVSGLLPGQPWHSEIAAIAFSREPMACFAIVELCLEDVLRKCSPAAIVGGRRRGHNHSKDACRQYEIETAELHDSASAALGWSMRASTEDFDHHRLDHM
jgi:hypothetical protein